MVNVIYLVFLDLAMQTITKVTCFHSMCLASKLCDFGKQYEYIHVASDV